MSLGAAKTALSTSSPPASYGVFITPGGLVKNTSNGSYTSPNFTANVTGGVGPFEYSWVSNEVNISSPSESVTNFVTSGFNREVSDSITVTVKDTGAANAEVEATASITIFFGVQQ
tara:strand:- start:679 stop:1026 length:348 start_codon:yes stop_codon:yes gene_type:complete